MYILGINPQFKITAAELQTNVEAGMQAGVGDIGLDADGKQYTFVQAGGTINQYDAVNVDSAGTATVISAANLGKFSVAPIGALVGDRIWVQCRGVAVANVVGAAASNTTMSWTTTAGRLTTATTNQRIYGIITLTSTALTTTGTVQVLMHVEPFTVLPV